MYSACQGAAWGTLAAGLAILFWALISRGDRSAAEVLRQFWALDLLVLLSGILIWLDDAVGRCFMRRRFRE